MTLIWPGVCLLPGFQYDMGIGASIGKTVEGCHPGDGGPFRQGPAKVERRRFHVIVFHGLLAGQKGNPLTMVQHHHHFYETGNTLGQ